MQLVGSVLKKVTYLACDAFSYVFPLALQQFAAALYETKMGLPSCTWDDCCNCCEEADSKLAFRDLE